MQQRYYDPEVGAFVSVDPVTAYSSPLGQFNRYRYANDNPYGFADPDGRQARKGTDRRNDPSSVESRAFMAGAQMATSAGQGGAVVGRSAAASVGALRNSSIDNRNNSISGGARSLDSGKSRQAAVAFNGPVQVSSNGPILVQPTSVAGPLATNQFYFSVSQRPLGRDGKVVPIHAATGWFDPVIYGGGLTGMSDNRYYQISPLPGASAHGNLWAVEVTGHGASHDNSAHNRVNLYVPVDD